MRWLGNERVRECGTKGVRGSGSKGSGSQAVRE
jgi:hypothetical protein